MNNKIQGEPMQHKVLKLIPLQLGWTAGVPSVLWNPENEAITLTDNGVGDVTITLAEASLVPLKLAGAPAATVADANLLGLDVGVDGASTRTAIKLVINSGADGATETDSVTLDLVILKYVIA